MLSEISQQLGINGSLVTLFVIFTIFHIVVSNLYSKPYQRLFELREKSTSGAVKDADGLIEKSEAMQSEYLAQMKDLNAKVRQILKTKEDEAKIEAAKILEVAAGEARQKIVNAQAELSSQKGELWAVLTKEVPGLATEIANKVLGRTARGQ